MYDGCESSECLDLSYGGIFDPQGFLMEFYFANALPVEQLIVNISLVNWQVSREASKVFWTDNSFRFLKGWIWDTVLDWLVNIGDVNRGNLRSLEIDLDRLQRVCQLDYPLGARTQLDPSMRHEIKSTLQENARERVYPRNRHLVLPKLEDNRLLAENVDNISPAVESIFRLLGRAQLDPSNVVKHSMTIRMVLPRECFPGRSSWNWAMSMDLPNVMEKCREIHTAESLKQVEVLWLSKQSGKWQHTSTSICWDMISESAERPQYYTCNWPSDKIWSTARRKKINGEIVASMPFNWKWYT